MFTITTRKMSKKQCISQEQRWIIPHMSLDAIFVAAGGCVCIARFKFGVFSGLIDTSGCKSDLSSATPQQPVWIGV